MLKGDLSSFSLGEIFQSLAINNHSGTLKITSRDAEKLIFFDRGEIRRFSHGASKELRIGDVLVHLGRITADDLQDAYATEEKTKTPFGIALLKKGLVTKDDVVEALTLKIQEELYDLFLWTSGHFEFQMDHCPDDAFDDLQKSAGVKITTNSVIMEGLRRLDEWQVIHTRIKTYNEIFVRTTGRPEGLEDLDDHFIEQIDGTRPVHELFGVYCGSRFALCKLLLRLYESGHVRLLTVEECLEKARVFLRRKQYASATHNIRFATELRPDRADLFTMLGAALNASYQESAASDAFMKAVRLHYRDEDHANAAQIGEKLIPAIHHLQEADLRILFEAYLKVGDAKKALTLGNQLAALLQKNGHFDRAAEALGTLVDLNPDDLNLLIEVGTLFQKGGDNHRAASYYETVANALEKQKKYRELLKILRLLQQIHPKSVELKQRVSATQALIEKLEQQKKRRVTIAGLLAIILGVLFVIPLMYEIKAREFFNYAARIEEVSRVSMNFTKAKEAYEDLLRSYSFSTQAAKAEAALERISRLEKEHLGTIIPVAPENPTTTPDDAQRLREEFRVAMAEATAAEIAGDFRRTHDLYREILRRFSGMPELNRIVFPLRVTTTPASTNILVRIRKEHRENQIVEKKGTTPFVLHYLPGETLEIEVSLWGCETVKRTLKVTDEHEIHLDLKRTPTHTFTPAVATYQDFATTAERFDFPSRDANLYAVDADRGSVLWKRAVGRFGDRVSDVTAENAEVYIGTVTGEVTAISILNGKSRWVTKVDNAVYAAPVVSPNGDWVAVATISGTVYLIDNRSGETTGQFSAENEVLTRPVFGGDLLIVGGKDNTVYFFSPASKRVILEVDVGADVISEPAIFDTTVVVSTPRALHGIEIRSTALAWMLPLKHRPTSPVCLSSAGAHVGTSSGSLLTFNPQKGELLRERSLGSSAVVGSVTSNGRLYVCLASGQCFELDPASSETIWSYDTELPILAAPVTRQGKLYINNSTGRFLVFEIIQ